MRLVIAFLVLSGSIACEDTSYTFRNPINPNVRYLMKYGSVRMGTDGLVVALTSDRDPGCSDMFQGHAGYFTFDVPTGPGGSFYVGAPFGSRASAGVRGETGYGLAAQYVAFELEPFELIPGARMRGRIRTGQLGEGAFEAVICPTVSRDHLHPLPVKAPIGAVSGSLSGKPFIVKTALATIDKRETTHSILSIKLYAAAGVTCTGHKKHKANPVVSLFDIGGASDEMNLHGSPQPTQFSFVGFDGKSHSPLVNDAWVILKELRFGAGEKIEGSFVVDTRASVAAVDQIKLAGHFEATICPR